MLVNIAGGMLGTLVFLFIFWKRLKEDYAAEIVFKSAFLVLFGLLVSIVLSQKLFPDWFLFAGIIGMLFGLAASVMRFGIRFYESLDALIVGFLPFLSFIFLQDSILNSSLGSFIGFLTILAFILLFYFLDIHYRGFTWYRSGRVGFAGLATAAIFFLVRATTSLSGMVVLSFVGKLEAIVSGCLAFICFLVLYNLGRIK